MIEVTISCLMLLIIGIFLIWLFSDEHCDKGIEKLFKEDK